MACIVTKFQSYHIIYELMYNSIYLQIVFIIYTVVKYRKLLMKCNVYFIFIYLHSTGVKIYIFLITSDISIDLLQCTSELQTPITFFFVNENMKCRYAFS